MIDQSDNSVVVDNSDNSDNSVIDESTSSTSEISDSFGGDAAQDYAAEPLDAGTV